MKLHRILLCLLASQKQGQKLLRLLLAEDHTKGANQFEAPCAVGGVKLPVQLTQCGKQQLRHLAPHLRPQDLIISSQLIHWDNHCHIARFHNFSSFISILWPTEWLSQTDPPL